MKKKRQTKLLELIEQQNIETQEELTDRLHEAGFPVTQATVSRDIRELQLTKITGADGRQRYASSYAVSREGGTELERRYLRVLVEGYVSMDMAQNILVIKTVAGMAMAVAAALDALQWKEIVGCIAGDDTIMCAVRSTEETKAVMKKIQKVVSSPL